MEQLGSTMSFRCPLFTRWEQCWSRGDEQPEKLNVTHQSLEPERQHTFLTKLLRGRVTFPCLKCASHKPLGCATQWQAEQKPFCSRMDGATSDSVRPHPATLQPSVTRCAALLAGISWGRNKPPSHIVCWYVKAKGVSFDQKLRHRLSK